MSARRARPVTPQGLRASLDARLRNAATARETSPEELRKQFAFTLLFRRLFHEGGDRWLVLGGNALILRTRGGRFTQDVDLARADQWNSKEELKEDLEQVFARDVGDPFVFSLKDLKENDHRDPYGYGPRTAEASVVVHLGGRQFDEFKIDISQRRHVDGPVHYIDPVPVIEHDVVKDLPSIPVVPIENHLADKICAMYEKHQGRVSWSTRYRDLADIVRIVQGVEIDAAALVTTLNHEQQRRRIPDLPQELRSPHDSWTREYPKAAQKFAGFPQELFSLKDSLDFAGQCLNEILNRSRTQGRWCPQQQTWREESHT